MEDTKEADNFLLSIMEPHRPYLDGSFLESLPELEGDKINSAESIRRMILTREWLYLRKLEKGSLRFNDPSCFCGKVRAICAFIDLMKDETSAAVWIRCRDFEPIFIDAVCDF